MTYASIYIKPDNLATKLIDNVTATTIQGQIQQAFNNAKTQIQNFDIQSFAQNLTLTDATSFVQKYATAGLTKIINGEEITNQTILDSLFNGFAPALDMTAIQMGFNSVMEMKNAIQSANINVTGFVSGFSGALSTVINNTKQAVDYSYLGDEITIDMIVDLDYQRIAETPDRRVQSGQVYNEYIHILPLILSFTGKIKEGYRYTSTEYKDLLDDVFLSKKPFTFRVGDEIYENFVFTSFVPARNFEEALSFAAEIKKIEIGDITLTKVNIPKTTTAKKVSVKANTSSNTGSSSKSIQNATTPKKIYGIGRVINIDQATADWVKTLESWK